MMRRIILILAIFFMTGALCFGQAGLLRDYVGLVSIKYHSDVISYMGKFKESFEKKGYTDAARAIDNYLKGLSGTGFIYVAPDGNSYVLTNEHVAAQSDSLSITFEKQDGSKTIYERLKVLYVDEENDLALLVFDTGVKPFTQGLSFKSGIPEEGIDVYAAGFPGLANTAIWQFSRGTISNSAVRLPKTIDGDETIGPYIQHTAQVDPGNSGGPLLVAEEGVPTGYAVIGINTLSARARQAANYAIPIDKVNAFIEAALGTEPVNERELITKKVDDFIKGLKDNKAVYDHIAKFLSNECTASNAEYAISELLDKAPRTVLADIDRIFSNDPVEGMSYAVGWYIESAMRNKNGGLKISLNSINSNDKGGFTVVFNVNDNPVESEWVREYGVYRMNTYSDIAIGNKALIDEKQKKKDQDKALRTDYTFAITAGYGYVFDYESAFYAGMRFSNPFTVGLDFYYGFNNKKYMQFGVNFGYAHAIRLNSFGLTPFGELGWAILTTTASKAGSEFGFGFATGLTLKGGLMFTTAGLPGLFGRVFYQHSFIVFKDKNESIKNHGAIGIGIGYGF